MRGILCNHQILMLYGASQHEKGQLAIFLVGAVISNIQFFASNTSFSELLDKNILKLERKSFQNLQEKWKLLYNFKNYQIFNDIICFVRDCLMQLVLFGEGLNKQLRVKWKK